MADGLELFTSLRYDKSLISVPQSDVAHAGWNGKVASPFYMLDFHRDRILRAARHWGWSAAVDVLDGDEGLERLSKLILTSVEPGFADRSLRVRVRASPTGELNSDVSEVPNTSLQNLFPLFLPRPVESDVDHLVPRKSPVYEVKLDKSGTGRSEFTHFKTTRRAMYDEARRRAGIQASALQEVLIVNDQSGSIMEGSTTTPYFWRRGRWVTPPVSAGFSREHGSGGNDGTTRRWALERKIAVEEEVKADSFEDGEECWLSNGVRGFMFGKVKLI